MVRAFPLATIKKIMKKAGVERASDEAAEALAEALESISLNMSRKAIGLMYHAKRKTVTGEDIRLAASQ